MNHFDAVDFSECHSEEVISFFWRSVYDPIHSRQVAFSTLPSIQLKFEFRLLCRNDMPLDNLHVKNIVFKVQYKTVKEFVYIGSVR